MTAPSLPTPSSPKRPLRVLLLCTSDLGGGAAESARRQLEALTLAGVDARLLVLHRLTEDERVDSIAKSRLKHWQGKCFFLLERLEIYLRNGRSRRQLFRFSTAHWGFDLHDHPWVQEADVLHLHWINQGFLSLRSLRQLAQLGKPIFATLHDLWMGTGGCHLPLEFGEAGAKLCPRYVLGCGKCPLLASHTEGDLSRHLTQRKQFLARPPFRYLAVSHAEARLFAQSPVMRGAPTPHVVPNPIDTELFTPVRAEATPAPAWYEAGRYYLTLVAARLDEEVKGPALLKAIAQALRSHHPELASRVTCLLVGGMRDAEAFSDLALPYIALGSVRERETLAEIYRHSSLLLSTSLYETFGQTLVEALSTGTPVVSFRCGGPEDIILPGVNGMLIPAYDVRAYAEAVAQLLTNPPSPEACRESIRPFTAGAVADVLIQQYQQSLLPSPTTL